MFGQKIVSHSLQIFNRRCFNSLSQNIITPVISQSILPCQNNFTKNANIFYNLNKRCCVTSALENSSYMSESSPMQNVNHLIKNYKEGRLFAIVHLCGKQFRIVEGDIIVIEGYWPPDIGDKISLDKVLLAGASDFTLIGRPLVKDGLVKVTATVIEKTLSHTRTHFKKKRRKQFMRINFQRCQHTMLRINEIEIQDQVNSNKDTRSEINI